MEAEAFLQRVLSHLSTAQEFSFAHWSHRGRPTDEAVGMLNLLTFTRMPRPGESRPNRWGYLANCYVRPEHRNSGLGARLLATCTAYADEQGFVRVVLSPSTRSVSFYTRGGFAPATSLMVREPRAGS